MKKGWTCVYISDKVHQVEMIRAILRENEIDSVILDKRDSVYITVGDIELFVPEENAILARVIIEQNQDDKSG
jgi:hypothetical protein